MHTVAPVIHRDVTQDVRELERNAQIARGHQHRLVLVLKDLGTDQAD